MPSSGCASKPALRSAPDEKPRPAPVTSTARTDGSEAGARIVSRSAAPNSAVHAFRVSGRVSVMRPIGPCCSQRTVLMKVLSPFETPYLPPMLRDAVEWLGHSGFRVAVGRQLVYIDPYRVAADAPKADLILITHGHYDHYSPQDVERLTTTRTELIAPPAVAEMLNGRVHSISPGEEIEPESVRGVAVRALAAYNTSKRRSDGRVFHPREGGWVGYDVNVRGERLYHAGDTDVIPEMDAVHGVDVALLPVSGTYVMTASEAAEAARRIQPRVAVPMHWGENLGTRADAEAFARQSPDGVEVVIMEKAKA